MLVCRVQYIAVAVAYAYDMLLLQASTRVVWICIGCSLSAPVCIPLAALSRDISVIYGQFVCATFSCGVPLFDSFR